MKSLLDISRPPTRFILDGDLPIFMGVKLALADWIGRECVVGDRLPTIRELARSMAVSPTNVQSAVRELVEEGVLFSRKRLGLFVRALPSSQSQLQTEQARPLEGRSIGLMVFCDPIPAFIQRMIAGFQQAVAASGADSFIISNTQAEPKAMPRTPECWGLVLFNPDSSFKLSSEYRNVTVVSTADHLDADLLRFDWIGVDQYQGGMLAGQLARQADCDRACFLGRWVAPDVRRYDVTSSARLHGFEHAWGTHLDSSGLMYLRSYGIDSGAVGFRDYMKLSPRPDAVFAACDDIAIGFMVAAIASGLRAGRDYQLIGFDGQDERNNAGSTKLTTIRVPAAEMGRLAGQMMLLRADDPSRSIQRVALPCSVIDGDTANRTHPV